MLIVVWHLNIGCLPFNAHGSFAKLLSKLLRTGCLSTAKYLADAGHKPLLLEARDILGGKVFKLI